MEMVDFFLEEQLDGAFRNTEVPQKSMLHQAQDSDSIHFPDMPIYLSPPE